MDEWLTKPFHLKMYLEQQSTNQNAIIGLPKALGSYVRTCFMVFTKGVLL